MNNKLTPEGTGTLPRLYIVRECARKRVYTVVAYVNEHALSLAKEEFDDFDATGLRIVELQNNIKDQRCEVIDIFYVEGNMR